MSRPSKYLNDPTLSAAAERVRAGEISRTQAAENLGIPLPLFLDRLRAGKMIHILDGVPRDTSKSPFTGLDPDSPKAIAYATATKRAIELHSVKRAFDEVNTPELNLNYVVLCRKVAEIKDKSVKVSRKGETYTRKHKEPKLPEESAIEYLKRKSNIKLAPQKHNN